MKIIKVKDYANNKLIDCFVDEEDYETLKSFNWVLNSTGYVCRRKTIYINKTRYYPVYFMHRELLKAEKGQIVDHINGNKLDNQKNNLRFLTHKQNTEHRTVMNSNNTSGYRGVYFNAKHKTWRSRVKHNYQYYYFGTFSNPIDAAKAAEEGRKTLGFK